MCPNIKLVLFVMYQNSHILHQGENPNLIKPYVVIDGYACLGPKPMGDPTMVVEVATIS